MIVAILAVNPVRAIFPAESAVIVALVIVAFVPTVFVKLEVDAFVVLARSVVS